VGELEENGVWRTKYEDSGEHGGDRVLENAKQERWIGEQRKKGRKEGDHQEVEGAELDGGSVVPFLGETFSMENDHGIEYCV
jgi:hypothetical protein